MNTKNRIAYLVPALMVAGGSMCFAVDDITAQLGTSATTAISSVLGVVGTILLAAIAIPVAKKVYSLVKSAFGKA